VDTLPEPIRKGLTEGVPLGRLSEPRDVANAVLFLASQDAEFLTGVCLAVDGGKSIS
jgi:3-oxoacyl-[acyl-carrier protein] reductase